MLECAHAGGGGVLLHLPSGASGVPGGLERGLSSVEDLVQDKLFRVRTLQAHFGQVSGCQDLGGRAGGGGTCHVARWVHYGLALAHTWGGEH